MNKKGKSMVNGVEMRNVTADTFLNRVGIELKRAERYRFFVSLIALDLSFVHQLFGDNTFHVVATVLQAVQSNIRIIDDVSIVGKHRLVLLLPETSRQGAEIAARRLTDLIRNSLSSHADRTIEEVIPLEMVSFPDAAGAKSVKDFMGELARQSSN
jgi:GGDEF domain-containing protein